MIAPLAITLALAFWAPYNGGQPICPTGVTIDSYAPVAQLPVVTDALGWSELGAGCHIHIAADAGKWPVAAQCAVVAHELGHARFSLQHSRDRRNLMHQGSVLVIPRACQPKTRR